MKGLVMMPMPKLVISSIYLAFGAECFNPKTQTLYVSTRDAIDRECDPTYTIPVIIRMHSTKEDDIFLAPFKEKILERRIAEGNEDGWLSPQQQSKM